MGEDEPPIHQVAPADLAQAVTLSDLALSPDGQTVAFVSDRSGARELWTVPARGGPAVQRTHLGQVAASPLFSPDGATLYFTADTGGDERPDLHRCDLATGALTCLARTPTAEWAPALSPDGRTIAVMSDPDRRFRFDLHLVEVASGRFTRLTHEEHDVSLPRWSHDGRTVAATVTGDDQHGDLLLVRPGSGELRRIPPPLPGGILWAEAFSPDDRTLVCTGLNERGFLRLVAVDLATGASRFFGPEGADVEWVCWKAAGPLVLAANEGGYSSLLRLEHLDAEATALPCPPGVATHLSLDARGQRLAYLLESSIHPGAVLVQDLPSGLVRPALKADLARVPEEALAPAEPIHYPSGSLEIHGFLYRPRLRRPRPAPLVVWCHGGPSSQSRPEFSPLIQALVAAGFVVLAPNFRGSTGYGRPFEDANNRDWGGGDLDDLLAGARHLATLGIALGSPPAIAGGSYGGYLTLRALTHTPARWSAGLCLYGMADLERDYQLTEDRFGPWYRTEMGTPTSQPELFRDRSPIHRLEQVRAPLLVLQGANDTNVPRLESDELVSRLRALGKEVDYVVYPDEGHGFTHRRTWADLIPRAVGFFRRHHPARG